MALARRRRYVLHASATVRTAWLEECVRRGDIPVVCRPYGNHGRKYELAVPLIKSGRKLLEWKLDWPPAWIAHQDGCHPVVQAGYIGAMGLSTWRIGELQILIDYLEEFTE